MGAKRVARFFASRRFMAMLTYNIFNSVKASRALPLMFTAPGGYSDVYDISSRKTLVFKTAFEF